MTEPLGLTPSQTVGPYLSIGLLDNVVPPSIVPRGRPARDHRARQAARR